jgi:energy-coupling factor transporter ATP-binding protein EcfA2
MEKLIVKNFGAICDVDIELKPLTIFIGETGTGKSTLAKLISIFRNSEFWLETSMDSSENKVLFERQLLYYDVGNYLSENTYIHYENQIDSENTISFTYNRKGETIFTNFYEIIITILKEKQVIRNLNKVYSTTDFSSDVNASIKFLGELWFHNVIYIPADRSVVSFLTEKMAAIKERELLGVFPEPLTDFSGRFNRISSILKKHYVELFDITYQKINGKDYVELPNGKVLLLSETASGMQAAIPVILVLEYFSQFEREQKKSYTVEEPELNLFPIAQKALVEFFAQKVLGCGHRLVITTHSPYILTSLNNLLFAYQVGQEFVDVENIVPRKLWMNVSDITSFFVENGVVRHILDEELQQIMAEEIDRISSIINADYDKILEIQIDGEN